MSVRWHENVNECPHMNDHACPFCDFDHYYRDTYPEQCGGGNK